MTTINALATNRTRRAHASMMELYQRLNEAGFDQDFVRQYVLPDWWDDTMGGNPTTRALAEIRIARVVGVPIKAVRGSESPLEPILNHDFRLKRNRDVQVEELRPAIALAQSLGSTFAQAFDPLPSFQPTGNALDYRQAILSTACSVDLGNLLEWCWTHGIIVVHLCQLPKHTKKFSGIAMFCGNRPVIVLAAGYDSPPWLAFHLAHELGHLLLGHVKQGEPLLDYDIDQRHKINELAQDPEFERCEAEANAFAMTLLTERPDLKFEAEYGLTAEKLAKRAQDIEQRNKINAGTLALIYGRTAARMGVAQNALKFLGLQNGAHQLIANAVKQHLPEDMPEAVAVFLPLIGCES